MAGFVDYFKNYPEDDNVEFINKDGALGLVDIGIVKCHYEIGTGKCQ